MKHLFTVAYYEFLRMFQSRSVLILLFGMPLLIIFILGSGLSSFFVSKEIDAESIRLALWMEDDGFVKPALERFLTGSGTGSGAGLSVIPAASKERLRELVDNGGADIGLAVPDGFSEAMRLGLSPQWEFTEGPNLRKSVAGLQRMYRFFDEWNHRFAQQDSWAAGTLPSEDPLPVSSGAGSKTGYVRMIGGDSSGSGYTATQYYAAHMLVMFMLYSGMASAISLVMSKEDHTLMRLRSLPVSAWWLLLGKAAGQCAVMMVQALLIIAGTALLYGVGWGSRPLLLLFVCLLLLLFCMGLAVTVGIAASKKRTVIGVFQCVIIAMTFFSGGFTPSIGDTLSRIGSYTVSHWASQSFLRLMLEADASLVLQDILVLACWAGGAVLAACAAYGKAGYHE